MEQYNNCVICLDDIDSKNIYKLDCCHVYHQKCIDEWLLKQNTCPICRKECSNKENKENKKTNFAIEKIPLRINNQVDFGRTITLTFQRNGDYYL